MRNGFDEDQDSACYQQIYMTLSEGVCFRRTDLASETRPTCHACRLPQLSTKTLLVPLADANATATIDHTFKYLGIPCLRGIQRDAFMELPGLCLTWLEFPKVEGSTKGRGVLV